MFRVGDLVRIISDSGEWNRDLEIGMWGIVVRENGWHNGNGECIAVDWSVSGKKLKYCHSIGGILEHDTGYWVNETQVELVEEDYCVGEIDDLFDGFGGASC